MNSIFHPVEISRSGDFVAGIVTLPRPIEAAKRPALWTPGSGRIGHEDDFQMDTEERAWAALQLHRSHRHHEMVAKLAGQGLLTLRPGLPGFGTATNGSAVTSWTLDALHYRQAMELLEADPLVALPQSLWTRLDAAGSTAELVQILEPVARLPQRIWSSLDELMGKEKGRSN